uniref:Uncharacterized protein n=1 Tax=Musa acuminata subsp. malaccensis TaxID=214687 RepID=A0A804KZB9_MUSAM
MSIRVKEFLNCIIKTKVQICT